MKRGAVMNKISINSDVDSVVFYKPTIPPYPGPKIAFNGITLCVHPTDNSTGIPWNNGTNVLCNATSLVDGIYNTRQIIYAQGAGNYSAYLCDTLVAYGYSDWYLPSKDELNALYVNRASIGGFIETIYLSSTEFSSTTAMGLYFLNGKWSTTSKIHNFLPVRCVRRD